MTTDMVMELLIGCGSNKTKKLHKPGQENWNNLITLDNNKDHKPDVLWDLNEFPYPFEDNTFDEIHAYEVLEHTGRQGDYKFFFEQFSEFWRILKPNGTFIATCPSRHSPWAWGDPSHTRVLQKEHLIFLQQAQYNEQIGKSPMSDFRDIYKADFKVTHEIENNMDFHFALEAIK